MSAPTINGVPLLDCTITEQSAGAWHADAVCDAEAALSGGVTLIIGGATWVGTALRSKFEHGVVRTKVVGGAAGLSKELPARNYAVNVSMATVIGDILREAGETLAASVTGLSHTVGCWHRERGMARDALTAAAVQLGYIWRVLRDGTLWLGQLAWAETKAKVLEIDSDWAAGAFDLLEATALEPGTTYQGHRIAQVTHSLAGGQVATEARVTSSNGVLERILEPLRRSIDRSRTWLGQVALQQSDGSLQVLADSSRMRGSGADRVQMLLGLPGCEVEVPPGPRGAWTLAEGDPSKPRWTGWEPKAPCTYLRLTVANEMTFNGGTKAVARVDDTADCGELYMQVTTSTPPVYTLFYRKPGLTEMWTPVVIGPIPPLLPNTGTPLAAVITSGCAQLKA